MKTREVASSLTPIELSTIQVALPERKAVAVLSLPAEVTRSLYGDLLRFGPNYENVVQAAEDIYSIYGGGPEVYKSKRQNQLVRATSGMWDSSSGHVSRTDISRLIDRVVQVHWPIAHIWLELVADEGYASDLDTDSNWYAMKLAPLASTFQLNSEDYRWHGVKVSG